MNLNLQEKGVTCSFCESINMKKAIIFVFTISVMFMAACQDQAIIDKSNIQEWQQRFKELDPTIKQYVEILGKLRLVGSEFNQEWVVTVARSDIYIIPKTHDQLKDLYKLSGKNVKVYGQLMVQDLKLAIKNRNIRKPVVNLENIAFRK